MNLNAYQNIEGSNLPDAIKLEFGCTVNRERGYSTKYEDSIYPIINAWHMIGDNAPTPELDKNNDLDYDIKIHCRCGGGNREDENDEDIWFPDTLKIRNSKQCVLDVDDDFDCTYADLYIKLTNPEAIKIVEVYNEKLKNGLGEE